MYNKLNKTLLLAFLPLIFACFILTSVHAGATPSSLAYNPATKLLYVTNSSGNNVYVVNTPTNTVINTITVGSNPSSIAINPQNTLLYVANNGASTISVISTASGTVVNTITGANSPNIIAFNPSGTIAYVTEGANDVVSVINVPANMITNEISLPSCGGQTIDGVAFTPDGTNALVASGCSGGSGSAYAYTINVVTNSVAATIALETNANPQQVAVSPGGGFAYISFGYESSFGTINLGSNTFGTSVGTGAWPGAIAFNQQGTLAYQLITSPGSVAVINPVGNTVLGTITVGSQGGGGPVPGGIAFSPTSGGTAWVTDFSAGTVSVINTATNTVINTITLAIPSATVSFSLTNNSITAGQTITFSTNIIGGTGPYNVELFNTTIGSNAITNVIINSQGVANIIQIQSGATGTFTYNELITDVGRGYTFNSATVTLTVSAASSGGGGGGGPRTYQFTIADNITSSASSQSAVFTSVGMSNIAYNQNQLPASIRSTTTGINLTFACTVVVNGKDYAYQNDIYGIGFGVPCGKPYHDTIPSIVVTYAPTSNSTTTLATSTTVAPTTTVNATTIAATTTISQKNTINITINAPQNVTQLCNSSTDVYNVKYPSIGTTFRVVTGTEGCLKITAVNATATTNIPNSNLSKVIELNVSLSQSNASVNATISYPCSISSSKVTPFILTNGTWTEIKPFSVNAAACTVTFAIPNDPIIGLFATIAASSPTTTVAPATSGHPSSDTWLVLVVVIAIIVFLIAVFVLSKGKKQRKS